MGEVTLYECDVTGERFGDKMDVLMFDVRWHRHSPFEVSERTVCLSDKALDTFEGPAPARINYVGVKEGEIVGVVIPSGYSVNKVASWRERDSVVIDHYEQFFEFLEAEVLY